MSTHLFTARLRIDPHGAMRPRFCRTFGAYKAPKQEKAEETLMSLLVKYQPNETWEGPLALSLQVMKGVPKSFSKKKREEALLGNLRPTTKPDLDNVVKHVKDCMTKLRFWEDDKQVVEYSEPFGAWYSEEPGYIIQVWKL